MAASFDFNKETFEERYQRILDEFQKRFDEEMRKVDVEQFTPKHTDIGELELDDAEEKCSEYEERMKKLADEEEIKKLSEEIFGYLKKIDVGLEIYEGEAENKKRERKSEVTKRLQKMANADAIIKDKATNLRAN